jgi:hypothetical protein
MKPKFDVADKKLMRLLTRFEQCAIARSWIGSTEPSEHNKIRNDEIRAREALCEYLRTKNERRHDLRNVHGCGACHQHVDGSVSVS